MSNNTLTHHGILGMRWGVRRSDAQLARARGSSKKSSSDASHEDYKKAHGSKNIKSMSDAELRNKLNRLQMERQYSQLSEGSVSSGKQFAQKFMKGATTVAAITTTGLTIYNNVEKIKGILKK